MNDKKQLGDWGEEQAVRYLRRRGYDIVERNFRCRQGEIDIIARKRGVVAFVEVKLRKNDRFAEAREFVTVSKQRRIIICAQLWLCRTGCELQPRFDVIEIYAPEGINTAKPDIRHLEGAFDAGR